MTKPMLHLSTAYRTAASVPCMIILDSKERRPTNDNRNATVDCNEAAATMVGRGVDVNCKSNLEVTTTIE